MKNYLNTLVVLSCVLFSSTAFAAVCVEVDESRDNLEPREQAVVRTMVEDSLRNRNQQVGRENCDTTYIIYSMQLGNTITATVVGPEGSKTLKAHNIDELPETYDQLVQASLDGGNASGVSRHNVVKKQAAPRREHADHLLFVRLGYGSVFGGDFSSGPGFGIGWRYELDQLGIELAGFNTVLGTDGGDNAGGYNFTLLRLGGLYFFDPVASSSLYLNGGLSWGWSHVQTETSNNYNGFSGSGLQGEFAVGFEFLRASTIRMFVEANAMLPFYTAKDAGNNSRYTPTFLISLGLGFDSNANSRQIVEVY